MNEAIVSNPAVVDLPPTGQLAGFIAEAIQGVGGTVVPPDDYLKHVYQYVRQAGGLCVSDEVQTGFGRTGTHFWGFQNYGVVPDIGTRCSPVTLRGLTYLFFSPLSPSPHKQTRPPPTLPTHPLKKTS